MLCVDIQSISSNNDIIWIESEFRMNSISFTLTYTVFNFYIHDVNSKISRSPIQVCIYKFLFTFK